MMATKDLLDVVVRIVVTETLQARAAPRARIERQGNALTRFRAFRPAV